MGRSPEENITYAFVLTSLAVSHITAGEVRTTDNKQDMLDTIYIYIYIYIVSSMSCLYIYIYIYIYIYEVHTIGFQTFFVWAFKIVEDY